VSRARHIVELLRCPVLLRHDMDHRQWCQVDWCRSSESWLDHLWLGLLLELHRFVRVQRGGGGFCVAALWRLLLLLLTRLCCLCSLFAGSGRSLFGCARSLLPRWIVLSKPLFPSLHLPIVVPNSAPIHDHPTTKLPEHTARGNDRDLSRAI